MGPKDERNSKAGISANQSADVLLGASFASRRDYSKRPRILADERGMRQGNSADLRDYLYSLGKRGRNEH
jgi:hypothetical protein